MNKHIHLVTMSYMNALPVPKVSSCIDNIVVPSQVALPTSDRAIVKNNRRYPVAFTKVVFLVLFDMNLAGPFLMIFDKPKDPETTDVKKQM